jgi:hypothetical protein
MCLQAHRRSAALLTLLIGNTFYARNIVASVLVMVWAARLAGAEIWPSPSHCVLNFNPCRIPLVPSFEDW